MKQNIEKKEKLFDFILKRPTKVLSKTYKI